MWKNRLTYTLVASVLLAFIYLQEHPMTYMAFYAVLIMPILSYSVAVLSKNYLSITQKLKSDFIMKEQKTDYIIDISNRSFLPCSFAQISLEACEVGLKLSSKNHYFSLHPYKHHEIICSIQGIYRGVYQVGIKDFIYYDFLGLFQFKILPNEPLSLTITPRIVALSNFTLNPAVGDDSATKNFIKGEDYTNIAELRAFQPTDSYRQIHWKATAKKGELISKNFHDEEQHAVSILVDNSRMSRSLPTALKKEDQMMEMVVSAMSYCHRLGYPILMQAIGVTVDEPVVDFTQLYQEASKLLFNESRGFNALLENYLNLGKEHVNLIIFVNLVSRAFFINLRSLILSGHHVTIFLFRDVGDDAVVALNKMDVAVRFID